MTACLLGLRLFVSVAKGIGGIIPKQRGEEPSAADKPLLLLFFMRHAEVRFLDVGGGGGRGFARRTVSLKISTAPWSKATFTSFDSVLDDEASNPVLLLLDDADGVVFASASTSVLPLKPSKVFNGLPRGAAASLYLRAASSSFRK